MSQPKFDNVPLECIRASTTNPRKQFNETALGELAESIRQQGVAQPILLRQVPRAEGSIVYFEIVAGERRFRASRLAGYTTVPAIIRDLDDAMALEIQVIENLQRADLHPLEEAEGYEQLMKLHKLTAEQLAAKVGKSKAFLYARMKLLALVPAARKAFYDGKLTPSTALLVARIPVKQLQDKAVAEITKENWSGDLMSTRAAQEHIQNKYMLQLKSAPFKTSDANLLPSAGTCADCPKRTGNQPGLFADVDSADVCTDPVCFDKKRSAHKERLLALAAQKGQTVISGSEAKKIAPYSVMGDLKGGYVALDSKCYDDNQHENKYRTYREILGKTAPAPVLLENPHEDGVVVEIVRASDIEQLLKDKGIDAPRISNSTDSHRDEEKKREAKAKIEKEFRLRLFKAVREKSTKALSKTDLHALAEKLFRISNERSLFISLYGWDKSVDEWSTREKALPAAIGKLDGQQATQLILDMLLAADLTVSTHNADTNKPTQLLAAAKRAGIDPEPIKAAVKAEDKARQDAKKKPAAKKVKRAA